jgi:hypothetical protein
VAESASRIRAALRGLTRREQRNLALQAWFAAVAAWALAWAALAAAVNAGVLRPGAGLGWVVLLVLAGIVAGAGPLGRWRKAGESRVQALKVEALRPDLKGALLTVIDREAAPRGSPALLARLAARAAVAVESLPPAQVHPTRPVYRLSALAAAAVLVWVCAGILLPTGPMAALAALRAPVVAVADVPAPTVDGPRAVVGDITLRYLYPTYTGREPVEIPNSNGEIHAPPGTRVEIRARTAQPYEAAALVVYDRPPEAAELVDGRGVRTAFTIEGPGVWRLMFGDLPSPDYRIVPDPDLPPDVTVQSPKRTLSVAFDAPLRLPWSARDDFGVSKVVVEVEVGGKKREVPLRQPPDVPRELAGDLSVTPKELGLAPGATAKLRVGAWDNDEISGSKAGYSAVFEVEVIGPRGQQERHARYRKLLRDALVLVLADFLVDPSPPVVVAAEAPAWAQGALERYARFDALVQEAWGGAEATGFDATVVREVREKRRAFLSFLSALDGQRIAEKDLGTILDLQTENVATLENAILMLDQVVRAAALASLEELVQQVAREASELQADFDKLDRSAALARLDQLARLYEQLLREAANLDDGQLRDFVNERGAQVQSLMDEIRKAIREGRMEDAQELMDRLAATMEEMAKGVEDMQTQRQQAGDDLKKAMEQVKSELEQLEADQRALRERTEAARERFGQDMEQAVNAWEEVERLSGTVAEQLRRLGTTEGEGAALPAWAGGSLLDDARADADGLHDSARARSLGTAIERADRVAGELGLLATRIASAQRRQPSGGDALAFAARVVDTQKRNVARIRDLLDKMAREQARTSPALQEELRRMAEEQQSIADRAEQTAGRAGAVAENLPMDAPGLKDGAERGAEQAGRAADAMREGEAMDAEGGQRAAEDAFRQAREALDEAAQNMQQMQQASRGSRSGDQEQGDDSEGGGDGASDGPNAMGDEVALPAPEAFRTPEEYRRALLEGMEGDVPEEYKALNRRYYEELVRQ